MILDGKRIKDNILEEIKNEVNELPVKPKLVVIQIGNDEASNVYIRQKANMCNYVGYGYEHIKLDNGVSSKDVLSLIEQLNIDDNIDGIMVQLPLPEEYNEEEIVNAICPFKDVDGLTDYNAGMLMHNKECLYPCTPSGVMELLDRYNIDVSGKHVVIVGRSKIVGKPMNIMMSNKNATVTICHSKTKNIGEFTRNADILVVAVGRPKFITEDMISEGTIVIDVGINRLETGLCGDVDYENIKDKVSYITPVPGGVGPMTVAMLSKNVLKAYKIRKKKLR